MLDIENATELVRYLRETGRIPATSTPAITVLAGGVSNRTVLVRETGAGDWVLKQALPKLRVARDWFCPPERIEREALGLQWLARLTPAGTVPRFIFDDRAQHLLAMEAVPLPHENWKSQLLRGEIKADLVRQFGARLGEIHRRSRQDAATIAGVFADRTYFEALRLEPYYQTAAVANPPLADFLHQLVVETRAQRGALVHGDYSPKNILVRGDGLVLLDYEVIHFGDPSFDVGFSLTHLLSKAHHLTDRRPGFIRAAHGHWESYIGALAAAPNDPAGPGLPLPEGEARAARHTLACLLARVDGRSPLEYLTPVERERQRRIVHSLAPHCPNHVPDLIEAFAAELER